MLTAPVLGIVGGVYAARLATPLAVGSAGYCGSARESTIASMASCAEATKSSPRVYMVPVCARMLFCTPCTWDSTALYSPVGISCRFSIFIVMAKLSCS
jgi:hypothetical protein